jgi:hypothetical protein
VPQGLRQDADPVQVHVDRQRGRRRALGQPALRGHQVERAGAHAAEVGGHGDGGVAGGDQVVEVGVGEGVGLVVAGRALGQRRCQPGGEIDDVLSRRGSVLHVHGGSSESTWRRSGAASLMRPVGKA